jgi:hypothetical protein
MAMMPSAIAIDDAADADLLMPAADYYYFRCHYFAC